MPTKKKKNSEVQATQLPEHKRIKTIDSKPISKFIGPALARIDSLGVVVYENYWRTLFPDGTKQVFERWFFVLASAVNDIRKQTKMCSAVFKKDYVSMAFEPFAELLVNNGANLFIANNLWRFKESYWAKPDSYGRAFLNLHLLEMQEPSRLFQLHGVSPELAELYSYKLFELFYPMSHTVVALDNDFLNVLEIPISVLSSPGICAAIRNEWAIASKARRVYAPLAKFYLMDRLYWNELQLNKTKDDLPTYYQITSDNYWANCFTRKL